MLNFLNGFTYQDLDLASDTPLLIRNTTEIIFFADLCQRIKNVHSKFMSTYILRQGENWTQGLKNSCLWQDDRSMTYRVVRCYEKVDF